MDTHTPFPAAADSGTAGLSQLPANHFFVESPASNVYHCGVEIFSENRKEVNVPEKRKRSCTSAKTNWLVIDLLVKMYRTDLGKSLYTR